MGLEDCEQIMLRGLAGLRGMGTSKDPVDMGSEV